MASHEQRITELEKRQETIFGKFDVMAAEKIEADKQKAVIEALAKKELELKGKEVEVEKKSRERKEFWLKLLWIPIILLIVSAILGWLTKCDVISLIDK